MGCWELELRLHETEETFRFFKLKNGNEQELSLGLEKLKLREEFTKRESMDKQEMCVCIL